MRVGEAERFMRRAIRLSRRGFPSPNPRVGCVLVKRGTIVGEGFHEFAGGPHAEIRALKAAGAKAKGATAYVTLEPCNHFGKTPPCANALLEAGVSKVVIACADPNPFASGGAKALRKAGVNVEMGLLKTEAEEENEIWLTAMKLGRPYVVVKAAASLDGRVAMPTGESKWITGPEARKAGHRLRAEMGAVLVGRGTVQADDPKLTARIHGVRNQPLRVVLDPTARLTGNEALFRQPGESLWVVAKGSKRREGQIEAPTGSDGFDLSALLKALWKRGLTGLLVEGGPRTIGAFLRAGLVDRIDLFLAPKVLLAGPTWAELEGSDKTREISLKDSVKLDSMKVRRVGPDLWIQAKVHR